MTAASMDALVPVIGVAAFALVALVIFRMVAADRERKAARSREAATHGFRPVVPPDPRIVERIVGLYRTSAGQPLEVRDLHRKEAGGHTLYLFDLADRSGESTNLMCDRAVAVVSAALRLPRFSIIPRIEHEGKLAAVGNWLLERFATRAGAPVDVPSAPAFERRYTLAAADEAAARRFFNAERLARLAETQYCMIEGDGDMLTVDRLELDPARRRPATSLGERLRHAERLLEVFADR